MPEHQSHHAGGPAACFDVELQRDWIEAGDVTPALLALDPLLTDSQTVRRYQGRLHLFIGGYDDDRRELWAIPEVRQYLGALDERFPYWLWFLDPTDPSLLLVVACRCELAAHGSRGDTVGAVVLPARLADFLLTHLRALEPLADRFGLPPDDVVRAASAVLHRLGVDAALTRAAASTN